jgi:hypothetical protein
MNPDQAAEMLQVEERGIDLLKRVNEDETLAKAIQQVQSGFDPKDVAELYGLDFDKVRVEGPSGESEPSTSGSARLNVVGSEAESVQGGASPIVHPVVSK